MRLSTDEGADEEAALETIAAAAAARITVFDTARAYGDNEALLARALRRCGADGTARIVTKGAMSRAGGGWRPDGRAKTVRADCEASLAALDGLPIDLYLLHAPDPRTPWATSVRALARLVDDRLVARVGVANVTRGQLDEALALAPVSAVQVALSLFDDRALRGGVVDRCAEAGVTLIAHSPLGGPRRAKRLDRNQALSEIARSCDATAGRGRARLAPRPLRGRRRDSRGAAARDRSLRGTRVEPRPRRAHGREGGGRIPRVCAGPAAPASERGRRGRRRHGHSRGREEPRRRELRRARLSPAQPRRARRIPPRRSRRHWTTRSPRGPGASSSTTRT